MAFSNEDVLRVSGISALPVCRHSTASLLRLLGKPYRPTGLAEAILVQNPWL